MAVKVKKNAVKKKATKKVSPFKTINFKLKRRGEGRTFAWLKAKARRYTKGNVTELALRALESYPNKARRHDGEVFRATTRK